MLTRRSVFVLAAALVFGGVVSRAQGEVDDGAGGLLRYFSEEIRSLAERRAELRKELSRLPEPQGTATSARLGWHSRPARQDDETMWVQLTLPHSVPVDLIALVPASGSAETGAGPGYGFPVRFKLEVSDEPTFAHSRVLLDHRDADVENPGANPVVVEAQGHAARYVRLTATKLWERRFDRILALGELMIVSRGVNVAAGAEVSSSASVIAKPAWSPENLVDGQSILGPPVSREDSLTNGYLAVQETQPDVTKWVQVDLGRSVAIDAVRLLPSRPTDFADSPGNGFPTRFRVEVSDDRSFSEATLLFTTGEIDFVNPGDNPLTFPAEGVRGRYVRVTATRLHDRGSACSFSLAELQVWAEGQNVAAGASVEHLDVFANPQYPRWAAAYLTDGYTSRHRLMGDAEWLRGLARRGQVERELRSLEARRQEAVNGAVLGVVQLGTTVLALMAAAVVLVVWRGQRARRMAEEKLRMRIAADLHDEIGSNLGGIALLAEAAAHDSGGPGVTTDLATIARVASDTHAALRDIVWLIRGEAPTPRQLATRMREEAEQLLRGVRHEFKAGETWSDRRCGLQTARHVWFIFKEAMANAAWHAGASRVTIHVSEINRCFVLEIADDGRGFNLADAPPDHGIQGMRKRAAAIGGALSIDTAPGRGTKITLNVPLDGGAAGG